MLKRVLSSDAMKPSKDAKSQDFRRQHANSFIDLSAANHKGIVEHDNRLLQQLVSEQESKFLAQVEEVGVFLGLNIFFLEDRNRKNLARFIFEMTLCI